MDSKKITLLVSFLVLFIAFFAFELDQYLSLSYLQSQQAHWQQQVSTHFWRYLLVFFVIYLVSTALSFPGAALLTLLAGALFGLFWGLVIASFASTLGASCAFLFSRYVFKDAVLKRWQHKLSGVQQGMTENGAKYLFSLRLVPIFPFFLINLLMGLSDIRLRTFYWVSQIGMLPGTLVYVNAGTELAKIQSLSDLTSPSLLIAFALLALLPYVTQFISKQVNRWQQAKRFNKPTKFDYNMMVIGAGAGGLVSSYIAATVKAKVAIIEQHKMGGDCLNTGCVPSKALLKSAHVYTQCQQAEKYGIKHVQAQLDFAEVMARVKQVISKIEPHDSIERYEGLGVECKTGRAHIVDPYRVKVGEHTFTTQNIIIATGAKPFVPNISGINNIDYLTSDTIWQLQTLPKRLLVLGAGPIGCELAQCFARFGSKVIIVDMAKQVLPREDSETAQLLATQLQQDGCELLLNASADAFSVQQGQPQLNVSQGDKSQTILFDQVLIAVGRKANTRGFGLEELGITLNDNGTIKVDDYLRTQYDNMYAVGDVAGPMQFTHFASHQAWYASVNALFGRLKQFKANYDVIPAVTYCEPQVARVGLNEQEAKQRNTPYQVTQYDLSDLDRAIADGATQGFVKVLTVPGKDKILGVTIVGHNAGEIIGEFVLAMKHGLGLNKILATVHAYPTMLEANKYAAGLWKQGQKPERILNILKRYFNYTRS
ncbi:dihydrolipoyl dehydrogenase [Motilimonas pumila]|uniref:Dihydrolipoyl dehydrogenase n=1 Tax=Motilimonas pumila TaxID=2303987 RepID=A0A418YG01_9GAMM|nr:dihydrolipoyl dehydrogenase [Motilimonas pumila]RJG48463.1 dihydrolipoyl dehydrogenase [Motilimonas pumila]